MHDFVNIGTYLWLRILGQKENDQGANHEKDVLAVS